MVRPAGAGGQGEPAPAVRPGPRPREARLRGHPEPALPCLRALLDTPTRSRRSSPAPTPGPAAAGAAARARCASCAEQPASRCSPRRARASRSSRSGCARSRRTAARWSPTARWCPRPVLDVPRPGWVNLHFSLLPAWRGAAPVQRAVLAGDEVTGASTFLLEEGLDTGPVLGVVTEQVRPTDTSGDLLGRLSTAGAGLLVASLDALEIGRLVPVPQPDDGVSSRRSSPSRTPGSTGRPRPCGSTGWSAPARLRPVPGRRCATGASKLGPVTVTDERLDRPRIARQPGRHRRPRRCRRRAHPTRRAGARWPRPTGCGACAPSRGSGSG